MDAYLDVWSRSELAYHSSLNSLRILRSRRWSKDLLLASHPEVWLEWTVAYLHATIWWPWYNLRGISIALRHHEIKWCLGDIAKKGRIKLVKEAIENADKSSATKYAAIFRSSHNRKSIKAVSINEIAVPKTQTAASCCITKRYSEKKCQALSHWTNIPEHYFIGRWRLQALKARCLTVRSATATYRLWI